MNNEPEYRQDYCYTRPKNQDVGLGIGDGARFALGTVLVLIPVGILITGAIMLLRVML